MTIITSNELVARYDISRSTLSNRLKDGTLDDAIIVKGIRSQGHVYDLDKCDAIALEGKLGSKAKAMILSLEGEQ